MDFRAGFHTCHQCDGTGVQTFVQQIGPIKQHIRSVYGELLLPPSKVRLSPN